MVITGRITKINEAQTFGTFTKRTFWIETEETYPQILELFFGQDKVSILDKFKVGQEVECECNLRGRHWEKDGREGVFISLNAWKIKAVAPEVQQPNPSQQKPSGNEGTDDGLTF